MQCLGPNFVSKGVILPKAKPGTISQLRTQNEVLYAAYRLNDILVIVRHFVFYAHAHYS